MKSQSTNENRITEVTDSPKLLIIFKKKQKTNELNLQSRLYQI